MLFLDTNIFLRVLIADERRMHLECKSLVAKIAAGSLQAVSAHLILAELQWTLASFYQFPKEQVVQALESVIALDNLKFVNDFEATLAVSLYRGASVKFIDAIVASQPEIRAGRLSVVSYDRDFDKLGVKRLEPAEILLK